MLKNMFDNFFDVVINSEHNEASSSYYQKINERVISVFIPVHKPNFTIVGSYTQPNTEAARMVELS